MEPWRSVHLTRARQVGELMELRGAELPSPDVSVRAHYETLRTSNPSKAVSYIGHALPRREAIHWAAGLIDPKLSENAPAERATLEHARLWLDAPDDDKRRQAYAAAQSADREAPERSLATAIFYSGGSIAPEGVAPVQPAPGLANRLAVVAVVQAAWRSSDPKGFLAQALARAEAIAEHGIQPSK